jgi:hypothetical protein
MCKWAVWEETLYFQNRPSLTRSDWNWLYRNVLSIDYTSYTAILNTYSQYKYKILQLSSFHVRDLSETEEQNQLHNVCKLRVFVSALYSDNWWRTKQLATEKHQYSLSTGTGFTSRPRGQISWDVRSSLFLYGTQTRTELSYRRFGATCRFHIRGSTSLTVGP